MSKVYLKPGVSISGVLPETVLGIVLASTFFNDLNQKFTLTSVCDGLHKTNSLHYFGAAFDIRIREFRGIIAAEAAERLQEFLGNDFRVICEVDHIHVQLNVSFVSDGKEVTGNEKTS